MSKWDYYQLINWLIDWQINQYEEWTNETSDADIDAILEQTKLSARIIIMPTAVACDGAELALFKRANELNMLNGFIFD